MVYVVFERAWDNVLLDLIFPISNCAQWRDQKCCLAIPDQNCLLNLLESRLSFFELTKFIPILFSTRLHLGPFLCFLIQGMDYQ
jgi:hypothetical protein